MKVWMGMRRWILSAMLFAALMCAAGCHSYHIETTVENRTGGAIQLLEVDYPSASFGANTLASGECSAIAFSCGGRGR